MDSNYILTSNGGFLSEAELYHHGTKGMKWGVRRYQNPDGSLTAAGRKRYTNSDGTLNKKGEKYVAKETERLKAESQKLANQKKTAATLAKLDQTRKKNADLEDELSGKKAKNESEEPSEKTASKLPKEYDVSSLTKAEIDAYNQRMQSEDNFKQLLEKRGYKVSLDQKTEIDQRIETLSKEKTLKQLEKDVANMSRAKTATEEKIELLTQQRDISKLEKEIRDNTPKKENKLSKFMNSQAGQNITNQLIKSGENVLTTYIKGKLGDQSNNNNNNNNNKNDKSNNDKSNNDKSNNNKSNNTKPNKNVDLTSDAVKAAANKTAKILSKEAEKVAKSMEKQTEKWAKEEAKQEAKAAAKETKQQAKTEAKTKSNDNKVYEGTVEGEGTSRSFIKNDTKKGPVYDAEYYTESYSSTPVTSLSTTSRSTGYDYVEKIKTDYGYRYIYELPSGSSGSSESSRLRINM